MTLPDLFNPSLSAWIVAFAAVGALALSPSLPAQDETRVARPPAADVSINQPTMRGGGSEGALDMLPFAYDLDERDEPSFQRLPAFVDAES